MIEKTETLLPKNRDATKSKNDWLKNISEGHRWIYINRTLNAKGEIIKRNSVLNTKDGLLCFSSANQGATLIIEGGSHSPWIRHLFEQYGHKVIVVNPRKPHAIYESDNKNDLHDA